MGDMGKELRNYSLGPQAFENAVMSLMQKPALSYMRELRKNLDSDPDYLEKHKSEVMPQLDHWLSKQEFIGMQRFSRAIGRRSCEMQLFVCAALRKVENNDVA